MVNKFDITFKNKHTLVFFQPIKALKFKNRKSFKLKCICKLKYISYVQTSVHAVEHFLLRLLDIHTLINVILLKNRTNFTLLGF